MGLQADRGAGFPDAEDRHFLCQAHGDDLPAGAVHVPRYDAKEEYREIQRYLKSYSNRTVWNIFWSANNYEIPHPAPKLDTKIQFWVGTDEWGSRFRDLKWYQKYLPQLELVRIANMAHGEYVMMHPKEFSAKALAFFEEEQ